MGDTSLEMRLALDAARWSRDWSRAQRDTKRATGKMRADVGAVGSILKSVRNKVIGLGAGFGFLEVVKGSAQLDKNLIRVRQTAGATAEEAKGLRKELYGMGSETGQRIDDLKSGFDTLIQSGESWKSAMMTIPEINRAMGVTGAKANVLASALSVGAEAFDFDLSKPGLAIDLLDQMTVAGQRGNAELEDLSSVFGRIGVNAKTSNLSFAETLGFVEQLSLIERNPQRLSTLADSTLRIFTNQKYKKSVSNALGVDFFDSDGGSVPALDVLDEISSKYKKLTTDARRASFIDAAFGKTDLDTQRGLRSLLSGDSLEDMRDVIGQIENSSGTIASQLEGALDNSVDQASRLKTTLGEAADRFAQPINDVFSKTIKKALDPKEKGGLNASGGQLLTVGGLSLAGLLLGKKFGGRALSRLTGGALSTAKGLAVGKSLEATTGVKPVYVVNMPAGLGGKGDGGLSSLIGGKGVSRSVMKSIGFNQMKNQTFGTVAAMGGPAILRALGFVGLAGAAGYGAGSLLNDNVIAGTSLGDKIGESIAKTLAFFGNDNAQASLARQEKYKLQIEIESKDQNVTVKDLQEESGGGVTLEVLNGYAFGAL